VRKENAGAEAKPGGVIMVLQCKKGKLFVTGEVFLLDIGLLMGGLLMGAIIRGHTRKDFALT